MTLIPVEPNNVVNTNKTNIIRKLFKVLGVPIDTKSTFESFKDKIYVTYPIKIRVMGDGIKSLGSAYYSLLDFRYSLNPSDVCDIKAHAIHRHRINIS